ncbi:hypothetical protein A3862_24810 [Methylobacterium sp. XJLW]|nr:hypothetical protein A3862_24810 [Methylobacterium sp. XJLW]KOX49660.1 hypothetical protein ADL19_20170 [Streptomyces purpurogeneiscleroticus]MBP30128.1 hypothetical protein [Methylobacterium sp.]
MRSIIMRTIMLAAALLALPVPASALCRCTCVRGEMKAICQETDLTIPICQGLCETTIRPDRVIIPLAGARQAFEPAQSTNPAPGGLVSPDLSLDTNPNGTQLGTPSQLSGSVGSSLSSGSGR